MRKEDPKFIEKRKKFYAEQKEKSQDKYSKGGLKGNEPQSPSKRRDEKKAQIREARMSTKTERYGERYTPGMKTGGLSPKQKVIAAKAPPPNKITGEDFDVMKKEKVMKAKQGDFMERRMKLMGINSINPKVGEGSKPSYGKFEKLGKVMKSRAALLGAVGAGAATGLNMAGRKLKKVLDERKARKRDEAKVKKMGGGMIKRVKGGPAEESDLAKRKGSSYYANPSIAGAEKYKQRVRNARGQNPNRPRGPAGPADPAESRPRKTEDFSNNSKFKKYNVSGSDLTIGFENGDKVKKMGGGMMNKPMGYKSGKSIKVKCKLGKNKPTKLY